LAHSGSGKSRMCGFSNPLRFRAALHSGLPTAKEPEPAELEEPLGCCSNLRGDYRPAQIDILRKQIGFQIGLAEVQRKKLAMTLGWSLGRLGWPVIRISLPRLGVLMLCDPLNRVMFRNKALDYFRFAIGPQNIDPPARSRIFPSHVSWSLLEHQSECAPTGARFKSAILPQSNGGFGAGFSRGFDVRRCDLFAKRIGAATWGFSYSASLRRPVNARSTSPFRHNFTSNTRRVILAHHKNEPRQGRIDAECRRECGYKYERGSPRVHAVIDQVRNVEGGDPDQCEAGGQAQRHANGCVACQRYKH